MTTCDPNPNIDGFSLLGEDVLGRPKGVVAQLTRERLALHIPAPIVVKIGTQFAVDGCIRAHLISLRLGFGSDNILNIVSLIMPTLVTIAEIECKLIDAVEHGNVVDYKIVPIFFGTLRKPRALTISAQGSGSFQLHLSILSLLK